MAARPHRPSRRTVVDYVGLAPGSAAILVGAVLAAWLGWGVFVAAHRTFGWVVACAVVALLLDPAVRFLGRHLPRPLAVITVLVLIVGVFVLIGVGVAREATTSLDELVIEAPRAAEALEERYDWAADVGVAQRVDDFVTELDERIRESAVEQAIGTVPAYIVTGILMLFFLALGHRYVDGFLRQISAPRRYRWRYVITRAAVDGRGWMLGSIGVGLVVGITVGVGAWWADLPAAVILGVIAGGFAILPVVGIVLGGVPVALLAFGFEGWRIGAGFTAVLLGLQVVDALVVRPALERRTVRVGVTVPILVGLLGFELYRGGGAIYSIAIAVLVLAALEAAGYRAEEPEPEPEPELAAAPAR